jgi:RimJ/RimL family protein N-acetyltransferase
MVELGSSAMSHTPVVETARLRLRAHARGDLHACLAMWSDPRVLQYLGGRASSLEESWSRLLRYTGHWAHMGFGLWAVEEKASRRFIGEAGYANFHRELNPSFADAPEGGWVFAADAHGKGYATEAMQAAGDWMDRTRGRERRVCLIEPANIASLRVAEKLGFTKFADASYRETAVTLLETAAP